MTESPPRDLLLWVGGWVGRVLYDLVFKCTLCCLMSVLGCLVSVLGCTMSVLGCTMSVLGCLMSVLTLFCFLFFPNFNHF